MIKLDYVKCWSSNRPKLTETGCDDGERIVSAKEPGEGITGQEALLFT